VCFHYRFHFLLDRNDRAIWRCEAMEMRGKLNEREYRKGEKSEGFVSSRLAYHISSQVR